MDLDRSTKNLIQSENDFFQSVNRLEAQMSRLINIVNDKNEKTLPNIFSTILIALTILIGTKNHGIFETLTKSQFHHINLNLINFNPLTNWKVFHSVGLNLNLNVTLISNLVIQFPSLSLC